MLVPISPDPKRFAFQAPVRVAVLGCSGSIGSAALDIIAANPERFKLFGIAAGSNVSAIAAQASKFRPQRVVLAQASSGQELARLKAQAGEAELDFGADAVSSLASDPEVDLVLAAISGAAGLSSTLAALQAGKVVALANKESLVCAGELVAKTLRSGRAVLLPVDSEHSAIFQALQGERWSDVARLILTASGGPFLDTPATDFAAITPQRALQHPRWKMGPKITIDSASMMNKALELIEAHWLFGIAAPQIEVVVHPQSIVHSLVEFKDGSQMAQLSRPDMHGPIGFALNYPHGRLPAVMRPLDLLEAGRLDFRALDEEKFPFVALARRVLTEGGSLPMVFNAANEVAVERFLKGGVGFNRIRSIVEETLGRFSGLCYTTLDELLAQEALVREAAAIL